MVLFIMATHSASELCTEGNLGVSLSLRVLVGFLGRKLFSQFSPRPFFHVFHLFQNVCKRRRERWRGGGGESKEMKDLL